MMISLLVKCNKIMVVKGIHCKVKHFHSILWRRKQKTKGTKLMVHHLKEGNKSCLPHSLM